MFVDKVPTDVTKDEMRRHFSRFGEIVSLLLIFRKGQRCGFGYVQYSSQKALEKALGVDNVVMGYLLKCKHAIPKKSHRKAKTSKKSRNGKDFNKDTSLEKNYSYTSDLHHKENQIVAAPKKNNCLQREAFEGCSKNKKHSGYLGGQKKVPYQSSTRIFAFEGSDGRSDAVMQLIKERAGFNQRARQLGFGDLESNIRIRNAKNPYPRFRKRFPQKQSFASASHPSIIHHSFGLSHSGSFLRAKRSFF